MRPSDRLVILFARAPRLGQVKRRLAAGIGDIAALAFYRITLRTVTRRLARDPRWRLIVAVTPDGTRIRHLGRRIVQRDQGTGDLGVRMARALRPRRPDRVRSIVVVGSDIPEVSAPAVWRAFIALRRVDMVFGPASDGGYWLVGARRRPPEPRGLFADVAWSTATALADSIASVPRTLTVAQIDQLDDIDTRSDWLARRRRMGTQAR